MSWQNSWQRLTIAAIALLLELAVTPSPSRAIQSGKQPATLRETESHIPQQDSIVASKFEPPPGDEDPGGTSGGGSRHRRTCMKEQTPSEHQSCP